MAQHTDQPTPESALEKSATLSGWPSLQGSSSLAPVGFHLHQLAQSSSLVYFTKNAGEKDIGTAKDEQRGT